MDPLSILASSAALGTVITSFATFVARFKKLWQDAPREIEFALRQARVLEDAIRPFKGNNKSKSKEAQVPRDVRERVSGSINRCKKELRQIHDILKNLLADNPTKEGLVLKWGLVTKKEVQDLGKELALRIKALQTTLARANL